MMKRFLATLAIVGSAAMSAQAANNLVISPVGTVGGGATVGSPVVDVTGQSSGTLYIWVTDNVVVNRGLATNIAITGTSGKVALTGAQAYNYINMPNVFNNSGTYIPAGASSTSRWESVSNFGSGNINVTSNLITDLNATTPVSAAGINSANNGFPAPSTVGLKDPGYDVPAGLFLYGAFTFDVLDSSSSWSTTISLQPSTLDIASAGNSSLNSDFDFGSVTITNSAVPEPASLGLLAIGGLTLLRRRRA